jgi:hypothetical protein
MLGSSIGTVASRTLWSNAQMHGIPNCTGAIILALVAVAPLEWLGAWKQHEIEIPHPVVFTLNTLTA